MEKFIFIFLVFWGLLVIAKKYQLPYKLGTLANKWNSKILYEISECEFCFEHHLAAVTTIVSFLFFTPELKDLCTPIMVAALSNLIKSV